MPLTYKFKHKFKYARTNTYLQFAAQKLSEIVLKKNLNNNHCLHKGQGVEPPVRKCKNGIPFGLVSKLKV